MPLRVGDYSVRQDGYTEITLRTERDSGSPVPLTLIRGFQGGDGTVNDDVFGFDPADGKMKMYGSYRGIPQSVLPEHPADRHRFVFHARGGYVQQYVYGDQHEYRGQHDRILQWHVFAAIETVTTPAGTFDNCMKYTGRKHESRGAWTAGSPPGSGR